MFFRLKSRAMRPVTVLISSMLLIITIINIATCQNIGGVADVDFKNFTTFDSEETVVTTNNGLVEDNIDNIASGVGGNINNSDGHQQANKRISELDTSWKDVVSSNNRNKIGQVTAIVNDGNADDDQQLSEENPSSSIMAKKNFIQKVPTNKKSSYEDGNFSSNSTDEPDSKWLSGIFDFHDWNEIQLPSQPELSSACTLSMKKYITSLKNGSTWAVKMSDASGRYASQFFFGNDFWLGSRRFCRELHRADFNPTSPPFKVHFYVVKFIVKLRPEYAIVFDNRVMTVGLCLPEDCSTEDIKSMLKESTANKSNEQLSRSVNILKVRSVPGDYSLLADKKLHLLFYILAVVMMFMIVGTCYELSLERKRRRCAKKQSMMCSNNNEVDINVMVSKLPVDKVINEKYELNNGNVGNHLHETAEAPARFPPDDGDVNVLGRLLLSFSALSNSRKILNCGPAPKDSLTCIHGLRFLSLSWVIMVHTYLQVFTVAENKMIRTLAERNFMFQTVSNATFSVDTFFFISGCLVAYLYFKSARKDGTDKMRRPLRQERNECLSGFQQFLKLVGYRYLRLTPAYMFVLLIAEISMRWLHSISVFEPISQNHISCDKYWWRNILYINSLFEMKDMCMLWSWYVSNDTQFYVLGVIILLLSVRHFRFAFGMLITFLMTSWFVTILIAIHVDYRARIEDPFANFDELYDKPWTRLGPYLVGMFVGWFLFKIKCKLVLSKATVLFGWFLSLGTLFSLVYGLHVFPLGLIGSALYVSVGHTAWGVALAWIVVACCSGHGGFIDSFLSCQLLQPLSRLTYCAYLVHPIIMTVTNFQMGSPLHLQDAIVVILYLGNLTSSFIASFAISMLFEAPTVRLLKIIFSPQSKKPTAEDHTSL